MSDRWYPAIFQIVGSIIVFAYYMHKLDRSVPTKENFDKIKRDAIEKKKAEVFERVLYENSIRGRAEVRGEK